MHAVQNSLLLILVWLLIKHCAVHVPTWNTLNFPVLTAMITIPWLQVSIVVIGQPSLFIVSCAFWGLRRCCIIEVQYNVKKQNHIPSSCSYCELANVLQLAFKTSTFTNVNYVNCSYLFTLNNYCTKFFCPIFWFSGTN